MVILIIIFSFLLFFLLCFLFKTLKKSIFSNFSSTNTFPPGPWGFPLLGFMPFLIFGPQKVLYLLANTYGKIFMIFLGKQRVIVLNDYHVIKEAFKEDIFSGRPNLKMLEVRNGGVHRGNYSFVSIFFYNKIDIFTPWGNYFAFILFLIDKIETIGLVCSEGKEWSEQRKFTMKHLKELGIGKQSMENYVQEELEELIERLRMDIGKPVDLQNRFNLAVLNVIWRITCGERYHHDDDKLQNILQKTKADLAETQYTGPLLFLPWLIEMAPQLTRWNDFVTSIHSVREFLKGIIESHKETYNPSHKRDFIDVYLAQIERTTNENSSFYKDQGEQSLLIVLLDLFMAGADTTSTTLSWAFLYMILYQKVQENVQKEIDQMIGQSIPTLEHRKKMPYTEATIMEILRKSCLVPMGLFHCTTSNTKFCGYDIPNRSVIMANFYKLHYDTVYWGDPHNFRPERFIDEYNCIKKYDAFLPFSIGKRMCPGESLAKDELFLFLTRLLQNFTFACEKNKLPSEKPTSGVILCPQKYNVIIKEKNKV